MIKFKQSIVIDRPVDEVYEFVSEVTNDTLWMPWLDKCELADGPNSATVEIGQQRKIVQTDFGVQSEMLVEATEVEPGQSYTFETVEGPIDLDVTYRYEPTNGSTRLTRVYEAKSSGFINKLLEPLMARRMKKRWEADFPRLKAQLEKETG